MRVDLLGPDAIPKHVADFNAAMDKLQAAMSDKEHAAEQLQEAVLKQKSQTKQLQVRHIFQ